MVSKWWGKKKRKGKSKSTNGGQFVCPSVKPNYRYEPKENTSSSKKGVTDVGNASKSSSMLKTTDTYSKNDNIITSNSYSALNDEDEDEEEDVENVYDEMANLFPNTKIGFVSNPVLQQLLNTPPKDDWDRLFQPMFDEYFNPSTVVVSLVLDAAAPRAVHLADSLVSTLINQDAPSTSFPSTQELEHFLIISQGFKESPKTPNFHDDLLHEYLHEDSTSQGPSSNVRPIYTPLELLGRWTKDHSIENVIRDPSHSVSTRKQVDTDVMWYYFDTFLTLVELKNFKQAMTKPLWIDAMQEEIHEFERLQVWELVSSPDKVMLIKLK
nr:Gag-Pol polyprotein [Tanacetum cinerariifolium]